MSVRDGGTQGFSEAPPLPLHVHVLVLPSAGEGLPGATTAEWADGNSGWLGLPGLSPFFGPPRVGSRKAPAVMETLWIGEAVLRVGPILRHCDEPNKVQRPRAMAVESLKD